jgi:DNA polymerase-3 subunit gamma/tau
MAYQVLARKYRPQRFADVAGQEHVTRTLLNALQQGRIAHGYIFSGHRGIGKTTIARIVAMALNCRRPIGSEGRPTPEPCGTCDSCSEIRAGSAVDVIEIDAATNRGIDEIRELREAARYRPARDRYKIYILDEAHQITDAAFNALLKTLEEPPEHVVFMMATTQPEDIPQTIRSRSQHFSFHAVKFDDILAELRSIAQKEGIAAGDDSLALLAEAGDGSMRDALSIMDQAIASAPLDNGRPRLDPDAIRELMGSVPNAVFERLLERISENASAAVMEEANRLLNAGNSPSQLARQFVRYLRNCLMAKIGGEGTDLLQISADEAARAARTAMLFSEEDLLRFLQTMLRTFDELNYRQEQRFHLELGLLKLVHMQRLIPLEEVLSQLPGGSGRAPVAARPSVSAAPRPSAAPPVRSESARTPATPPATPAADNASSPFSPFGNKPSPFERDSSRKGGPTGADRTNGTLASSAPTITGGARIAEEPKSAIAVAEPEDAPAEVLPAALGSATAIASPAEPAAPAQTTPGEMTPGEMTPGDTNPGKTSPDSTSPDLDALRDAVVAALEKQEHHTAAALLAAGGWRVEGDTATVEVGVKKTMLGLTFNPEADRIAKRALAETGTALKLRVVPGDGEGRNGAAPRRIAAHGGVETQALENPLVKQAQELFRAEVRSVLDLRDKG